MSPSSAVGNNFYVARAPAAKFVTYVLSNGASLRMNIATDQAGPRFANFDVFNRLLWSHKIETEASLDAAKDVLPDMSAFYKKFARADSKPATGSGPSSKQDKGHRR